MAQAGTDCGDIDARTTPIIAPQGNCSRLAAQAFRQEQPVQGIRERQYPALFHEPVPIDAQPLAVVKLRGGRTPPPAPRIDPEQRDHRARVDAGTPLRG